MDAITRVIDNHGRQVKWSSTGILQDGALSAIIEDANVVVANSLEHRFVFGVELTFTPGVGSPSPSVNITLSVAQKCPIGSETMDVFGTPRIVNIVKGATRQVNVNKSDITWDASLSGMHSAAPPVVTLVAAITEGRGDKVSYAIVVAQSPAYVV